MTRAKRSQARSLGRISELLTLPKNFSERDAFQGFLREFATTPSYWQIPKGRAVNHENLPFFQQAIRVARELADRDWNPATQHEFLRRLGHGDKNDAYARMIKKVLETCGLFTVDERVPIVTDAGAELLGGHAEAVLAWQVSRFQFPNPLGSDRQPNAEGIIPHIFLLEVALASDLRISDDEYLLFCNLAVRHSDLDRICTYIRLWRQLTDGQRELLLNQTRRLPLVDRDGQLRFTHVGSPAHIRVKTIKDSVDYQHSFFTFADFLRRSTVGVEVTDQRAARRLVNRWYKDGRIVPKFQSAADWITYYGDPTQLPAYFTVLYQKAAETRAALGETVALSAALTSEEKELITRRQLEREIEDYYENNLGLLEPGLTLAKKGRQFQTRVGRIDLLCEDPAGTYVVIEIKLDEATDSAFGQILRYLGYVHRKVARRQRAVRGIILASDFSAKAGFARDGMLRSDGPTFLKFCKHGFNPTTHKFNRVAGQFR